MDILENKPILETEGGAGGSGGETLGVLGVEEGASGAGTGKGESGKEELRRKEAKKAGKAAFCVYVGPSIAGVIQKGTVYRGGKEEALETVKEAVGRYPLIASLIIPDRLLPESRIKARTPGNLLYVNYHKLAGRKK